MYITVYDKDIAMLDGGKYEIFLEMQQHNGTTFDQDYISACICADLAPIKFKWQNILYIIIIIIIIINKCDTSNNMGNWNHFKIIQKIPEQRTGNPRSQGATENSHIGHCTHTPESTNVKVQ